LGATRMSTGTVAVWPLSSLTASSAENDPLAVGMPRNVPLAGSRLTPLGRAPPATLHENGPLPPPAPAFPAYRSPTSPTRGADTDAVSAAPTTTVSWRSPERRNGSRTRIVTVCVSGPDGVPEMTPFSESESPRGSEPCVMSQTSGHPASGLAGWSVKEYDVPAMPGGSAVVATYRSGITSRKNCACDCGDFLGHAGFCGPPLSSSATQNWQSPA